MKSSEQDLIKVVNHSVQKLLLFFLLLLFASAAGADKYEEGLRAYQRADYASARNAWFQSSNTEAHFRLAELFATGRGGRIDFAGAARWYERAANAGHSVSQYKLGEYYEKGLGVEKDLKVSQKWYRQASQQGYRQADDALAHVTSLLSAGQENLDDLSAEALYKLARSYSSKHTQPYDPKKGAELYLKAAERGFSEAQWDVARFYGRGDAYFPQDRKKQLYWLKQAVDLNNAFAMQDLGNLYERGLGVPENLATAIEWYRKAVRHGNSDARYSLKSAEEKQNKLGGSGSSEVDLNARYKKGLEAYKQGDFATALSLWRPLAEQGLATVQNILGLMYRKGQGVAKDAAKAVFWYKQAAEQGYANAQNNLAAMYAKGEGGPKDTAKAVFWYEKAAEQGFALAQRNLAHQYRKGEGVKLDLAKAVYWYQKSAENGDVLAQYSLARRYANGEGVDKDDAKAAYWYQKSAEQGNVDAQFRLAQLYLEGKGVELDYKQAFAWSRKAAEQGDTHAQVMLGALYLRGLGVGKDQEQGSFWCDKARGQDAALVEKIGLCP